MMINQYEQQQQEQELSAISGPTSEASTKEGSVISNVETESQEADHILSTESNDVDSIDEVPDQDMATRSSCDNRVDRVESMGSLEEIEESSEETRPPHNKRKRLNVLMTLTLKETSSRPEDSREPLVELSSFETISANSPTGSLLNRRSPSPQLSPTSASMRANIMFVKAGTDVKEKSPSSEQETSRIQEAMRLKSELAIGSRYATCEEIQSTKRKREDDSETGAFVNRGEPKRRNNSDLETNELQLILPSSSMVSSSLAMQDAIMAPRMTPESLRKSPHDIDLSREIPGGSVELNKETAAPVSITVE